MVQYECGLCAVFVRHGREKAAPTESRANHYEYCTFHSVKKDILEFFDWLRQNKYTLEIQGGLFDFADDRSHVDFHGNVCEYSAVFLYRIYSRELFSHIIDQLRTVKRHHAWRKRRETR